MTEYQALQDEIAQAIADCDDDETAALAEVVMPIVERELAARDAVIEQIRALAEELDTHLRGFKVRVEAVRVDDHPSVLPNLIVHDVLIARSKVQRALRALELHAALPSTGDDNDGTTHQSVCAWWSDTYPSLRCYCIGCRAVVLFTAAAAPLGDTK